MGMADGMMNGWKLPLAGALLACGCCWGAPATDTTAGAETKPAAEQPRKDAGELPEITVKGLQLQEDKPVDETGRPEWTSARRFPTTRVYLQQPPWGMGLEQWWKGQWPRGGGHPTHLFQEEFELGLPHRFQLDIYDNFQLENHVFRHHSTSVELRYALADWGVIPLNPTLYGEWSFVDNKFGDDRCEVKLLLGEDFKERWHWGMNLIYEREVRGALTTEIGASQSLSYTLIDNKLSVGVEMKLESETEHGARGNPPIEFDLGPSLQWRPTANTFLDVVPLIGVTHDSPRFEVWMVFGFDFGPGNSRKDKGGHEPVSFRSQ